MLLLAIKLWLICFLTKLPEKNNKKINKMRAREDFRAETYMQAHLCTFTLQIYTYSHVHSHIKERIYIYRPAYLQDIHSHKHPKNEYTYIYTYIHIHTLTQIKHIIGNTL